MLGINQTALLPRYGDDLETPSSDNTRRLFENTTIFSTILCLELHKKAMDKWP